MEKAKIGSQLLDAIAGANRKERKAVKAQKAGTTRSTSKRAELRGLHDGETLPFTALLYPAEFDFLDRIAGEIRKKTGVKVKGTKIVRALVDALALSAANVSDVRDESELRELLTAKLKGE